MSRSNKYSLLAYFSRDEIGFKLRSESHDDTQH